MNKQPLKIYKASAGSGKTYRLALEYIKLVISNPWCYDKILAVTFTNKATKEMKNRILKELYGISNNLPDSKSMIKSISEELSDNEAFNVAVDEFIKTGEVVSSQDPTQSFIIEQAKSALYNILHDYSRFRIETIDSFFQSILRNLAKELGLGAYLNIELDEKLVLSDAISVLFDEIKEKEKEHLLRWITNYMKEQIESGKPWKIQFLLEDFGENIFKEEYLRYSAEIDKKLEDHHFLNEYKKRLASIKKEKIDELEKIATEIKGSLENNGLGETSLSYGSAGVWGYIVKLSSLKDTKVLTDETPKRVLDCINEAEKWIKKDFRNESVLSLIRSLIPKLVELDELRKKNREEIIACELIGKNINNLGLLHDISRLIHQINSDRNTFLLAYTPTLLSEMIKESDAPFVYEKIGSHIEHIMIDEFQDTSVTQWDNFKPLIKESLSHGTTLIVGDPKQSIYRFRNGDWRILGEIKDSCDLGSLTQVKTLDTNWRSEKVVVDFNNNVFLESLNVLENVEGNSGHLLMQQLKSAYSDCEQKCMRGTHERGMVKVKFVEKIKGEESLMLQQLVDEIYELELAGVKPNEIAILVRTNKEIPKIASYFASIDKELYPNGNFDLVSDEAYLLKSSSAVEIILNVLRVIVAPESLIDKLHLFHSYKTFVEGCDVEKVLKMRWEDDADFNEMLSRIGTIAHLPLYELLEEVYRLFLMRFDEVDWQAKIDGQDAYLCFFMDKVSEYLGRNSPDISSFLRYWDEFLSRKSLPSNGSVSGIRILSIHKSKGLEFHSVLIPYCNWSLESEVKSYTKWYKTGDSEPYNQIPILPIEHQKKVSLSIFKEEYNEERIQNLADNLNILYVALTRAEKNLVLLPYYDPEKVSGASLTNVSNLLINILTGSDVFSSDFSVENMIYQRGTVTLSESDKKEKSSNPFDPVGDEVFVEYYSHRQKARFKQSIKSNQFIENLDEENDVSNDYLGRGRLLHYLFSNIKTIDDVPSAVERLFIEGVISTDEERVKLSSFVTEKLQTDIAKEWFRPGLTLYNECSILFRDENGELQSRRPDRVIKEGRKMTVIDFKFGKPSPKYQKQIDEYVDLLTKMGYEAQGHIWYVGVPDEI